MDTVDHFNNVKIYPRIQSLLRNNYFRFYKTNLKQRCPFWADDSKCAMKFCSVQSCEEKDVPEGIKGTAASESPYYKVSTALIPMSPCTNPWPHSSTRSWPRVARRISTIRLRLPVVTSSRTNWSWVS